MKLASETCKNLEQTSSNYVSAAVIALDYLDDVERAVANFVLANKWRDAKLTCFAKNRSDLFETTVFPECVVGATKLLEHFEDVQARSDKYKERLIGLQERRKLYKKTFASIEEGRMRPRRALDGSEDDKDDADDDINKNDGASRKRRRRRTRGRRVVVEATTEDKTSSTAEEVEEITKKWGLEAGLWKIFNNKETKKNTESTAEGEGDGTQLSGSRMDMAKQLLKTYGSAYLITSISLSLVSFGVFYVLVSSGVDVAALLSIIGITATQNSEKVGTVAIAYAAHKAASPIRFPPTVALTPIVAGWMGKTGKKAEEEEEGEEEEK